MEVETNIADVLKVDEDGFISCTGRDYLKQLKPHHQEKGLVVLSKIINSLGERSAISQKLKQVITTTIKFFGTDQRILIKVSGNKALGFVKVGEKKLFYHDMMGGVKELMPTAVLDIYVHESCQRTGIGKEVFEKYLKNQAKTPEKLAYDRPSEKLISFLKKHYNLCGFIPQNNNFVIFNQYFQKIDPSSKSKPQSSNNPKPCSQVVLERTNLNSAKFNLEPEDSLNKLAMEMNNVTVQHQPVSSFKEVKNQSKSSFGCPWAVEQKMGFRTTSNAYGNYYKRK